MKLPLEDVHGIARADLAVVVRVGAVVASRCRATLVQPIQDVLCIRHSHAAVIVCVAALESGALAAPGRRRRCRNAVAEGDSRPWCNLLVHKLTSEAWTALQLLSSNALYSDFFAWVPVN